MILKLDCDYSVFICCGCRLGLGSGYALGCRWKERRRAFCLSHHLRPWLSGSPPSAEVSRIKRSGAQSHGVLDDRDVFLDVLCASGRVLDVVEDLA